MARIPIGKRLLWNVIRHTDAHNKIQEESEMWKLRDMEKQVPATQVVKHRRTTDADWPRDHMHCDRYLKGSAVTMQDRLDDRNGLSDRDEREARYYTRKLYEFEANDPDRWGHSGFKELYPEEFQTNREKDEKGARHKKKKCKASYDSHKCKKSTKKKKRKKVKKKKRAARSDSEASSSAEDSDKKKQRRKSGRSKRRRTRTDKDQGEEEDCSTNDSDSEARERRRESTRKRHRAANESLQEPQRKKRKDWKAKNEERSEESSKD